MKTETRVSLNAPKIFEHFGDIPTFHACLVSGNTVPEDREMVAEGTLRVWKSRKKIPVIWALPIIKVLQSRGENPDDYILQGEYPGVPVVEDDVFAGVEF